MSGFPKQIFLGLETSCDETAAALVARDEKGVGEILSNIVYSQIEDHTPFGGVVPELAARAHIAKLSSVIERALGEASIALDDLDGIAVTAGPGLIGGLIVGLTHAKALAMHTQKPLYCVNHLEGHALTPRLNPGAAYPYLLLLVSGGHSQIVLVESVGKYSRWGSTIDDALGEAFDKTAKLLGLGFPGGPAVERAAKTGNPKAIPLPVPLRGEDHMNFSFSGLKTALRQAATSLAPLDDQAISDLCASFQYAVSRALDDRLTRALEHYQQSFGVPATLVAAGGVAANQVLRQGLIDLCAVHGASFHAPPLNLCSDNGAMIAWAGLERAAAGFAPDGLDFSARSRWPLDGDAAPMIGSGKRGSKA